MAASGTHRELPARDAREDLDARRIAEAFERAAALVESLLREGPYASLDLVMRRANDLVAAMSEPERIALLDTHPRLGADRGTLSAVSAREQGRPAEAGTLSELARLNDEYERRFGFRCVVFVAGRPKEALVPVMRARLERDRATELRAGLDELLAIARDRLES